MHIPMWCSHIISLCRLRTPLALLGNGVMCLGMLGMLGVSNRAFASCGIAWEVPSNHFDGINEIGELSYWREVGKMDLGDGIKVPLIIGFKPKRGGDSWLGPGWIIPILEANVVQVDENKFLLTQPDGITRQFQRKTDETDSMLIGQGNWAGKINGNLITLWASCGWKLTFSKGKLINITTPKNRLLNVIYINGRPTEIQELGRRLLRVEGDAAGNISGLTFGMNRVSIKMGARPRIDVVPNVEGTVNVIGGTLPAVQTIMPQIDEQSASDAAPSAQVNYEFAVNDKVQPTLRITDMPTKKGEHYFTWDAATGRLMKDGEWIYDIKPGRSWWWNAAIGRTNAKGQREFWHEDMLAGKEITETLDGKRREITYFASGILTGRKREITETMDGQTTVLYHAVYNEKGELLRESLEDGKENQFTYNEKGQKVSKTSLVNGVATLLTEYNPEGRMSVKRWPDGTSQEYFYDERGREVKILINNKLHRTTTYAPDGAWKKMDVYDEATGKTVARTFYTEWNKEGRESLTRYIEHELNPQEVVRQSFYNIAGELEKVIDSREGTYQYFTTPDGKRLSKLVKESLTQPK